MLDDLLTLEVSLTEFNTSRNEEQADTIALAMDWKAVGAQLWKAIAAQEQEMQERRNGVKKVASNDEPREISKTVPPDEQGVQSILEKISEESDIPIEVLESLPKEIIEVTVASAYMARYRGPLPPPEILARYNEIHPGLADRIVQMAERQQGHRIDLEKKSVYGEVDRSREALRLAFIVTVVIVAGAIYLLATGHPIEGFGALLLDTAVLVGAYIYGRTTREKERRAKSVLMAGAEPTETKHER